MWTGRPHGEEAFGQAVAGFERLMVDQPGNWAHPLNLAATLNDWAVKTAERGALKEAEPLFRRAVGVGQETALRFPVTANELATVTDYSNAYADLLERAERPADAGRVRGELTAFYRTLAEHLADEPERRKEMVFVLVNLGVEVSKPSDKAARRRAEQYYRLALVLVPDHSIANNNLAWLLVDRPDTPPHDPKQAVTLADRAVKADPENGVFWNTLGVARYRAGEYCPARDALMKSMKLRKGGDPNDWYFLAMIEHQLGNTEKARAWYNQAVHWVAGPNPTDKERLDPDLPRFHMEASKLLGLPNDLGALGPLASYSRADT
jgi:tetratricopeptide (TPR) repeat protein